MKKVPRRRSRTSCLRDVGLSSSEDSGASESSRISSSISEDSCSSSELEEDSDVAIRTNNDLRDVQRVMFSENLHS